MKNRMEMWREVGYNHGKVKVCDSHAGYDGNICLIQMDIQRRSVSPEERGKFMITAHAGCDGTADNSREYLLHAMELSVDALEIDVRKNEQGELVLSHDPASEEAVFLSDAFALLCEHPEKKINCDLKLSGLEGDVMELALKYGVEERLIFTGNVNPELFLKGKPVFPRVAWFANLELFIPDVEEWADPATEEKKIMETFLQALLQMKAYEIAGINVNFRAAERIWEKAGELGIGLSVWTVNEEKDLKIWLEREARNITSRNIAGVLKMQNRTVCGEQRA